MEERCMFCGGPAETFGPYKTDDLLCESCATDPREAQEDLRRLVKGVLWAIALTALAVWVVYFVVFSVVGGR